MFTLYRIAYWIVIQSAGQSVSLSVSQSIACSQTLSFFFKVRGAWVIKNKNRGGFIDRQRKEVGVGEEEK